MIPNDSDEFEITLTMSQSTRTYGNAPNGSRESSFACVLSEADRLVLRHSDGGHLSSFVQLGDAT